MHCTNGINRTKDPPMPRLKAEISSELHVNTALICDCTHKASDF